MGLFDKFKKKIDADIQALIDQLADSDAGRRKDAATKLGELGARATPAQSALEDAIADVDGEVCLAASDALSRIRKVGL